MMAHEWQELPWHVRWRIGVTIGVVLSIGAAATLVVAAITGQWSAYVVGSANAICAANTWRRLYLAMRHRSAETR